jgi:hypothetical protein
VTIDDESSLEGWTPEPGPALPLGQIVDLAFDYRGNTTVVKTDGSELEGYVFNRNAEAPDPFLQMFDGAGNAPIRIPYREIRTIRFTGKDTAAGMSYTAWLRRREQERSAGATPPRPAVPDDGPSVRR